MMGTDRRPLPRWLGLLGVAFFATHAFVLIGREEGSHALWSCHLANLVIAAGLLLRRSDLNAIGFHWLLIGLPMWAMDVTIDAEFLPTSTLTHLGGFLLGIVGIHALGFPRGAWWKASAGLVILWFLSRAITPGAANVNMSDRAWYGWETDHVPFAVYLLGLLAGVTGIFLLAERLVRRLSPALSDATS